MADTTEERPHTDGCHNDLDNDDIFRRLKENDPGICCLSVKFTSYSVLDPAYCFTVDWAKEGWQCISNNTQLKTMYLEVSELIYTGRNRIIEIDESSRANIIAFVKALSLNSSIFDIQFRCPSGGSILGEVFTSLAPIFQNNLRNLWIYETDFDNDEENDNCARALKLAVEPYKNKYCSLQNVQLCWNEINDEQAGELVDAFGYCNIRKLSWWEDNGSAFLGNNALQALAKLVGNPSSQLKELIFGEDCNKPIDSYVLQSMEVYEGASAFASALAKNTMLNKIDFGYGRDFFTVNDWQTFSSILKRPNSMLEKLHLDDRHIGDDGAAAIADALFSNNTILKELHLSWCYDITTIGWMALSNAFQNPSLIIEKLYLKSEIVDEDVMISFADILVNNKCLKELYLDGNIANDEIITAFSNALGYNDKLQVLNLGSSNDPITDVGSTALSRALCDTSSINATFDSNHTLESISCYTKGIHHLLRMNRNDFAAHLKIIRYHFDDGNDIQEIVNMEWQLMPRALAWIGQSDHMGLSLLYRLVKSVPYLFECHNNVAAKMGVGTKRKLNESATDR